MLALRASWSHALILTLVVATAPAWGQGPTVTTTVSSPTNNQTSTFTITIAGLTGTTKWKDFHIYTAQGKHFSRLGGNGGSNITVTDANDPNNTQTWRRDRQRSGTRIAIYANSANGFGNGTYNFTIDWNTSDAAKTSGQPITWKATKDGNKDASPSGSDLIDDNAGQTAPNVPQFTISANGEDDKKVPYASSWNVPINTESGFEGTSYEIYLSTKLNQEWTDPLGIGIETESHPVPSSWISSSYLTGTITEDGSASPLPCITVLNDEELVDNTFYLVFALKESGAVIQASLPIQVLITAPE